MTDRIGRRKALHQALAVAAMPPLSLLLAACEIPVPGQGPPPRLFRLTPKSTFRSDLPAVQWQLVLELPVADAGLNTARIALQRSPIQLEYYARANWTDRAPSMVQTLMIESYENSGRIVSVGRESIGLRSDFVLKTELREFQAEYYDTGLPVVHVGINAKLVQMPGRIIIGSKSMEQKTTATADSLESVISAYDDALGKVLKQLVEWSLTVGQEAYQQSRR